MLKIVTNEKYKNQVNEFIMTLPTEFEKSGEIVMNFRNVIKVFDVNGLRVNVKSFKKPHLLNQFVYANFRESKAKRSYKYAVRLVDLGINTPTPLAYMEYKLGLLLKKSAYMSIHEPFDGLLQELHRGTLEEHKNLIRQFALFTAELHEKKILHLDYSSGNILYKKNGDIYTFYLVDLNRMEFDKYIDLNKACNSFKRLWGSDEMHIYFAEEYAKARKFDVKECVTSTLKYKSLFWKYFNIKYPDASPYIEDKN